MSIIHVLHAVGPVKRKKTPIFNSPFKYTVSPIYVRRYFIKNVRFYPYCIAFGRFTCRIC